MSGIPTPQQLRWQDYEMGMFIHWAPNVYQESRGDILTTTLDEINPKLLDTDQWAKVASDLGAKYVVIVAKHVGGFCLWQTETSAYSVKNTPWRDGKGDVLEDLSKSLKRYDIKMGVYLSPMDRYHNITSGGIAIDSSKQDEYDIIYRQQLKEVLTKYGDMVEVWFDGSTRCDVSDILREYAPNAVVFQSKSASIRWVGNEDGLAKYPAWNSLSKEDASTGTATQQHSTPDGDAWLPLECDTTICLDWFWSPENAETLRNLDELMYIYYNSIGNGATLLINANPDDMGVIPEADALRAKEFGDEIKRRFQNPIKEISGTGDNFQIDFENSVTIDHVQLMEDISKGERTREHVLEGFDGDKWFVILNGTAIGHKKIHKFEAVTVKSLKLTITKYSDTPLIRSFATFYVNSTTDVESIQLRP